MRKDILDAISRAKVNKMVIMQAMFKEYVAQVDDLMHVRGTEPDSEFAKSVREFNARMDARQDQGVGVFTALSLPGRYKGAQASASLITSTHTTSYIHTRTTHRYRLNPSYITTVISDSPVVLAIYSASTD